MSGKRKEILGLLAVLGIAVIVAVWIGQSGSSDDGNTDSTAKNGKNSGRSNLSDRKKKDGDAHSDKSGKGSGGSTNPGAVTNLGNGQGGGKSPWADSKGRVFTKNGAVVVGLNYLTRKASKIVVGVVTDVQVRPSPDGRLIFSYFKVATRQSLKGKSQGTEVIRVLGGEIPGRPRLDASHQPQLKPGDEGIFFIDDDPKLWTNLVGSAQGFLRITRPSPTDSSLKDGFGESIFGVDGDQRFQSSAVPGRAKPLNESELITEIQKQVR